MLNIIMIEIEDNFLTSVVQEESTVKLKNNVAEHFGLSYGSMPILVQGIECFRLTQSHVGHIGLPKQRKVRHIQCSVRNQS